MIFWEFLELTFSPGTLRLWYLLKPRRIEHWSLWRGTCHHDAFPVRWRRSWRWSNGFILEPWHLSGAILNLRSLTHENPLEPHLSRPWPTTVPNFSQIYLCEPNDFPLRSLALSNSICFPVFPLGATVVPWRFSECYCSWRNPCAPLTRMLCLDASLIPIFQNLRTNQQ